MPELTDRPHIYKYKWPIHLGSIISVLFLTAILIFCVAGLLMMNAAFAEQGDMQPLLISMLCLFAPLVFLLLLMDIYLLAVTIAQFFTTLEITSQGLSYHHWPFLHIQARWEDADFLTKRYLFIDSLHLQTYQKTGACLALCWPFTLMNKRQVSIPLGNFNGWKQGSLTDDLRSYASAAMDTKAPGDQSDIGQNERVMAALSHAAIFLSIPGMLVPLILWMVERGKSPYAVRQSIQALIWQAIVHLFTLLFSILLAVLYVAGVFFMLSPQESALPQNSVIIMSILFTVGILIVALLVLAASVYSTIAIIRTAQGRDFNYRLIGKWVK